MESLREQLIRHEGMELFPYEDTEGVLTIGVGRNLQDVGLSKGEALFLLDNDIARAYSDLVRVFPIVTSLSDARIGVLANMSFNLGVTRLRGFKRMWAAIEDNNFETAAAEMLDSKWATQVGARADELANTMLEGY